MPSAQNPHDPTSHFIRILRRFAATPKMYLVTRVHPHGLIPCRLWRQSGWLLGMPFAVLAQTDAIQPAAPAASTPQAEKPVHEKRR